MTLKLIEGGRNIPIGVFQTTTIDHKWQNFDIFSSEFFDLNVEGDQTKVDIKYCVPFIGNLVRKNSIFEGYCVNKNDKPETRGIFVFETQEKEWESEEFFGLNSESRAYFQNLVKKAKDGSKNEPKPKGPYRYYHVMTRPIDFFINRPHSIPPMFYRWTPFECKDTTKCTHMVNIRPYA